MKKLIITIFLFAPIILIAQKDSLAIGKIIYEHRTYLEGPNERNGKATLLFNQQLSVYIHNGAPKENEVREEGMEITPIAGDEEGFPVYKNIKTHELLYKRLLGGSPLKCIIKDTLDKIDWKMIKEYRTLGKYKCQKARGAFAGRTYEAWFTTEIPISSGPYKLWGLPGMILEAKSTDGKVEFLFSSAELSKSMKQYIERPKLGRIFISYAEYEKASEERNRNLEKLMRSKGYDFKYSKSTADWQIEKEEHEE